VTSSAPSRRALALAAAEGTCPRCGAPRAPEDRYCLACGFALPSVSDRVAALRRRWITRLGWYPGDWIWTALAALALAAAATVGAVALSEHRHHGDRGFTVVPAAVAGGTRAPVATATVDTGTLPAAPEPGAATAKNGRVPWPAGQAGWTIVLVSYPKTTGRVSALATATRAAKAGLGDVGVIDSSRYASLQPGYFVVFTGIYGSKPEADAAVATARQAGFAGAYSREIVR